ncbi:hypothetical protein [Bacillus smithii]
MFEKHEILKWEENDWRKEVFLNFAKDLTNKDPKFPCVFGASGFQQNQLRFDFFAGIEKESIKL